MFQYEAKVIRIIDGDTLVLDLDLGFKIVHEVTARLAHVNTPEVINFTAQGLVDPAAGYVALCVPPGTTCIAEISRAEKYGRWLAVIMFQPGVCDRMEILRNPRVLNDELVREGFATKYEGGKK